jgi:hypothetical protein
MACLMQQHDDELGADKDAHHNGAPHRRVPLLFFKRGQEGMRDAK